MAFATIAHGGGNLGQNGGTWDNGGAGLNTSGADLILLMVGFTVGGTPAASDLADNNSLTWFALTARVTADSAVRIFYAYGTGIGRSGHTFQCNKTNSFSSIYVRAMSGALTASDPFDTPQENGGLGGSSSTTVNTGNITPSQTDCYVIAALGTAATGTSVTATNLSLVGQINFSGGGGGAYSIAIAEEIQTAATLRSETFNWTPGYYSAGAIASFKAAGGGGAAFRPRRLAPIQQAVNRAGTY